MAKRRVTREMQDEMVQLYTIHKLGVPVIAERLGIGKTTTYRYLEHNGIQRSDAAEGAQRRGQRGRVYKNSPETEKQLCQEYMEGASQDALARKYGYSSGGIIGRILLRHGYETRNRGNTYSKVDSEVGTTILSMFEQGSSASAIGLQVGLTYQNVCRYLHANGLNPNRGQPRGEQHPSWNGGRSLTKYGYMVVRLSEDSPFWSMAQVNGTVMEHRLVMAEYLGRPLYGWETVHHANGGRADNRIENLQLCIGKHGSGVAYKCMDCGSLRLEPVDLKVSESCMI